MSFRSYFLHINLILPGLGVLVTHIICFYCVWHSVKGAATKKEENAGRVVRRSGHLSLPVETTLTTDVVGCHLRKCSQDSILASFSRDGGRHVPLLSSPTPDGRDGGPSLRPVVMETTCCE